MLNDQDKRDIGGFVIWAGVGTIVLIVLLFAFGVLEGPLLNLHFKAQQNSMEYINTMQTHSIQLMTEAQKLSAQAKEHPEAADSYDAQRKAIVEQLRMDVAKMQPENVPASVKEFLRGEGQ